MKLASSRSTFMDLPLFLASRAAGGEPPCGGSVGRLPAREKTFFSIFGDFRPLPWASTFVHVKRTNCEAAEPAPGVSLAAKLRKFGTRWPKAIRAWQLYDGRGHGAGLYPRFEPKPRRRVPPPGRFLGRRAQSPRKPEKPAPRLYLFVHCFSKFVFYRRGFRPQRGPQRSPRHLPAQRSRPVIRYYKCKQITNQDLSDK
jgi:hypothetical protein